MSHTTLLVFELTILVLAIFLGFEVISKVPTLLHTPLMSGTNAIHGIVIVGAMLVAAHAGEMISELTLAITNKVPLEGLANTVHCYPTQAEVFQRIALQYVGSRKIAATHND